MARSKKDDAAPGDPKAAKPKKKRWYHNVSDAYRMAYKADKALPWWMALAVVLTIGVGVLVGALFDNIWYFAALGLLFSTLSGMMVLARRAESAAYKQIEGTPGAALSALKTIRRGWTFTEEPVAVDPRTQDMVFRGVGRPGVVLVAEGPPHRAAKLLEKEQKKVARVLPAVPVIAIQVGTGDGQVPLPKVARKVRRQKPRLNKHEVRQVSGRLTALGGARPPLPKGVDPFKARVDRKGMRGR